MIASDSWLAALRSDSAALAAAARAAGPDAAVPTCPGWTVADLLGHITNVHSWVSEIVESEAKERPPRPDAVPAPAGEDLTAPFEANADRVLRILSAAGPGVEVWNWEAGAPAPVAFWQRRMAHETAIHRVDAESAAGKASPVDPPELAVDGIDEYLGMLVPRILESDRQSGFEATFHFHATDVAGEWQVSLGPGRMEVRREHGKAAVAVRGPASDLELFLYNRRPADGLEVFGEAGLLDRWREGFRF
jgi:uncharacterized protein (TIGR03083 family)